MNEMRKISKAATSLSMLLALFIVCGCNTMSSGLQSSGISKTTEIGKNELYTDSDPIETDKLKIEALKPTCTENNNYSLSVSLKITNKESKTNEVIFKNAKLIKESTGAEYAVNTLTGKLTIEAELNQTATFSSTIPSSITEDNYKLSLDINDYKITYFLYEIPDSLRADRKISYHISDAVVKTVIVKDGRKAGSLLVYETPDNLSYCDAWYTNKNKNMRNQFHPYDVVTSDIDLYGDVESNLDFMPASATDTLIIVSGVKHVPSNGSLVLPRKHSDKELSIGNYAIKDIAVEKIYIPNTVHTIYSGNFTGIGNATIYYEGTEAEWKALFSLSSNAFTTRVVFNTSYK